HGKRNAKIVIARAGLPEAVTASATARIKTGSRSGAAGGNPTAKSRPDPATESRNRRTRVPVPGDRFIGSPVHRFICAENPLRRICTDPPMARWSDSSSPPVVLLEGGDPSAPFLEGADSLDRRGRCRQCCQARDPQAQGRRADRSLVVVRLASQRRVDDEL